MARPPDQLRRLYTRQKIIRLIEKMSENELSNLLSILENKAIKQDCRMDSRKSLVIPAHIKCDRGISDGLILNMSETGAYLETQHPLPTNHDVTLRFSVLNFENPVNIAGKVAWANACGMGIEFKKMSSLSSGLDAQKVADAVKS